MEITIFAKTRTALDGRKFTSYISRLPLKAGGERTVTVKFREDCGAPKSCPCNIIVDRENANVVSYEYTDADGEIKTGYTMWISEWIQGSEYVDHSLDEYDL